MKVFLNSILCLIITISFLKLSYFTYLIGQSFLPFKKENAPSHEFKKENKIPSKVFKITPAQAAETKSAESEKSLIPRPADKLLARQWDRLRAKEAELKRKEKELKKLEKIIQQKIEEQKRLAQKIENLIKKAEVLRDKKIKHLVKVYSNMDPARAAQVLEKLDTSLAVKILAGMKGRIAGEILSNMDSKRAAELSEALTAFQTPFEKKKF